MARGFSRQFPRLSRCRLRQFLLHDAPHTRRNGCVRWSRQLGDGFFRLAVASLKPVSSSLRNQQVCQVRTFKIFGLPLRACPLPNALRPLASRHQPASDRASIPCVRVAVENNATAPFSSRSQEMPKPQRAAQKSLSTIQTARATNSSHRRSQMQRAKAVFGAQSQAT